MNRQGDRLVAYVVDDEEVIASTLELILVAKGFNARSFVDPLEALKQAESAAPDLLITDVMMPEMNGIELAIQVTQRHPHCKILLFSGHASAEDLYSNAKSKGYDFELLTKPVHPNTLIQRISELFGISFGLL